ncbi:MAG: HD domain-containing protein [Flavobacteriales bacterium]|nr:HD domain-containing protein [Flavobacteriales bacterium]
MSEKEIIEALVNQLKEEFANEATGHDWYHIERVWKLSKIICEKEGGDNFVVELGALLHDIADHKFVENADAVAEERINIILSALGVEQTIIDKVQHVVANCSFKGGVENKMKLLEGLIVQDADRMEAIGAIGIARTFAYGGSVGNPIYDPTVPPTEFKSAEEYRKKRSHTINHFYEKLLKLKDGMNTKTGKAMAEERHLFMTQFLDQFYAEWDVKLN